MTPEQLARANIDRLLEQAGWAVQEAKSLNPYAGSGVAAREFALESGHGSADYLLYVNRKAVGVIEAKPEGHTLAGVEVQSDKYSTGLPDTLPAYRRPLPFLYESTGVETRFTNLLDPEARSRAIFSFHTPKTLAEWIGEPEGASTHPDLGQHAAAELRGAYTTSHTLRERLTDLPSLNTKGLWSVQIRAISNLEKSLAAGRPRALVQMATGSGKTFMACNQVYRLIKYADARRVLFLVDRANLGRQTLREFQGFTIPDDGRKFTELYNVQLLQSGRIDPVSRVCIATIQRVYSLLKGEELDPELEELSGFDRDVLHREPAPVEYNPDIPIEKFDFIITDECHRSIYNLWRQVLEYFDAFLIGLTATPSKQTFGFFQQNLVMEYNHQQAVADGVNVDSDTYRIRTEITQQGSSVKAGYYVDRRDRSTRKVRWEQLNEDFTYAPNQLDREVVAEDQIRTVIRTFRDRLFTEIFPRPNRKCPRLSSLPKMTATPTTSCISCGRNSTRATTSARRSPTRPRAQGRKTCSPLSAIATTRASSSRWTMIATGTDIKPVEIVFFMRHVRSRSFFEQMKGRGVRTISATEFNAVTPDAPNKDRFVIIDAVGVTEDTAIRFLHPGATADRLV